MATLKKSLQREALKLVSWQFFVIMVLSVIILTWQGINKGISTFLGGASYVIPQFFFAWRVFSFAQPRLADQFMLVFFIGEFAKLIVSAILFILFIKYLGSEVSYMMAGYITVIVSFWFICGWHFGRSNSKSRISL